MATDWHLALCMVYIDLNMVRAGAVGHPSQWAVSGYNEIQSPPARLGVIDMKGLRKLTGSVSESTFRKKHREWVEMELARGRRARQPEWTEEVAVGPDEFTNAFSRRKKASKDQMTTPADPNSLFE